MPDLATYTCIGIFLTEKIDSKMTDPNLHRPSLQRRSVSESDTDPMASATNPGIYPNRFIPTGRTESQPHVSGLRFITEGDRQL